ncbi:MAG: class I SAM-dependent methyltransferase [Rhodothermales bacterium]
MLRKNWERLRNTLRGTRDRLPVLPPQEGYDRWAARYEDNMNPVQILEADALLCLLPDLHDSTVLDLGCGKGRVSRLAQERGTKETVGIDISAAMLKAAAEALPTARWVQGSVLDLPFEAASFDVVVGALMMGHVQPLERALAEVARVLRPGGFLVLSDFHPYAVLRGWQRAFTDPENGHTFAIENHPHLFDDYVRCFHAQDLTLEALEEPRYEGFPLVFALRARKKTQDISTLRHAP